MRKPRSTRRDTQSHTGRPTVAAAAVLLCLVMALTSCGAGDDTADSQEEPTPAAASQVQALDGYWRDASLPEPVAETILGLPAPDDDDEMATAKLEVLAADRHDGIMRLVMAWLPAVQGAPLGSIVLSSHNHRYEATPFIRLADRETGELIEPLRGDSNTFSYDEPPQIESAGPAGSAPQSGGSSSGEGTGQPSPPPLRAEDEQVPGRGTCICSLLSGAEQVPPEGTELIFVDFPAPESDVVDVVPGEWAEPITDVPLTDGEPFVRPDESSSWFFTHAAGEDPPQQYGSGARHAIRYPIASRSETLSGMVTTVEEETQAVSLPADVLFEFGSADLTEAAADVISSAADKLNEEAADMTVTVEGHTDNIGSEELNQNLSRDRADAVAGVIEDELDDSITLETVGYGYSRPQVPNTDADGEPLPQNQQRNRRVSFRYPVVVQEAGMEVDLGDAGIPTLPEAQKVSTEDGAKASFEIEAPPGDTSEADLRFDVIGAQRDDELVTMRFAVASTGQAQHSGSVFSGNPERGGSQHFGHNPQGDGNSPGLANMSLIEVGTELRFFPLSSGDRGCLCTEVAGTVDTLPGEQSPMYAQFHLPEQLEPPVLVHVPDAGQFELPSDIVEQMTAGHGTDEDD